jgi:hypothetical protein
MTEEDVKNFLTNNGGRLLMHIGILDERESQMYFQQDTTLAGI